MIKRKRNYHKYIDEYMDDIRSGKIPASKELHQAMDLIEKKLNNKDVFINNEKIDKAVELTERYFKMKLLNWELFLFALIHCYYKSTDMVVFDEFLIVMGRGNGKNGFISPVCWYLSTHYHGVKEYNIDIIANNEDQAKTSFDDIFTVLKNTWSKSKKFFYKSKQKIVNLKTNLYIKYNTSNAKTKDGKRSACLVFDEIHEYETWDTIKVFTSGFGKRKHSRIFYITTNGYVRGGILDEQLELAQKVLTGEIKDLGLLPLIYKIDSKEEAENPEMWVKANPSLPFFPELQKQMKKESIKMKYQQSVAIDFMTKRMNLPCEDNYTMVAPWKKILATNQPIPYDELKGLQCIGAIDYAQIIYKCFMSNGVLLEKGDDLATNTKLKVVSITGGVRILNGVASVNGSQAIVENEDIPIDIDGKYKIVLEWNVVLNKFVSKYIDDTEPLKRTKTIHQLQLAQVQKSGATYTITDTRADQNVCGYANRMLDSQAEYLRQRIDKIADYPIECGTKGNWTWEKYASGKFICECTYNINTDFSIAYGNVYKPSTGLNEIKLPHGFKEEPILDGKIKFGGIGGVQQSGSSNTELKFWVWNAHKLTHNT